MKEEYYTEKRRAWMIWLSVLALLLIGVGIFFYYTFLRQTRSELIDAVPTDAMFLFEVYDNDVFQKGVASLAPYFTEGFALDVLPAYEDMYKKLSGTYDLTVSGHPSESGVHVLFNTHIEKPVFRKLLRALSIDPANFTSFEHYKIYSYGTHFKSLKFVYFNHILTISDDLDLLKKALIQHTHPKGLLSDRTFKELYQLTNKNQKQNWLLVKCEPFGRHLSTFLKEDVFARVKKDSPFADWSAFQVRITRNELFLSGYTPASEEQIQLAQRAAHNFDIPGGMLPFNTEWYYKRAKDKYATCRFSVLGDSSKHHEFLVLMQDTLHKVFVPFGDEDRADQLRAAYPSGIIPLSDSVTASLKGIDLAPYRFFVETTDACLFAPSQEALTLYYKMLNKSGSIANNKYFKFSESNSASANLQDFTYYNANGEMLSRDVLSDKGKASFIGRDLAVFSVNCTGVADGYAAINIYAMFQPASK
ncbi:MAG: hypothetical protein J5730_03335 [Bacteroidales bacterium]|nr:hypothetical protein [Bacteroidales bacterium]